MIKASEGLHVSAQVEDALNRWLGRTLKRFNWTPRVTTSVGYGVGDNVNIFARVLLSPPAERRPRRWGRLGTIRRPTPVEPPRSPRGWRSLLTLPVSDAAVSIDIGGRVHELRSNRGGYVDARLDVDLRSGWHQGLVGVGDRPPVSCQVRIVDANARTGIVCDIDDTLLVTWVPRPMLALWNSFVLREHARTVVPGMPELLRVLSADDSFVVYLSTGAWNFAPHLTRFMAEHKIPPGPLMLTDWGPTHNSWFRSGSTHKRDSLELLRLQHPNMVWTLIGDDGQRDPVIYREFANAHPEAVRAVAIRQLSAAQSALAKGPASLAAPPATPSAAVTWVEAPDGFGLMQQLHNAGIMTGPSSGL